MLLLACEPSYFLLCTQHVRLFQFSVHSTHLFVFDYDGVVCVFPRSESEAQTGLHHQNRSLLSFKCQFSLCLAPLVVIAACDIGLCVREILNAPPEF